MLIILVGRNVIFVKKKFVRIMVSLTKIYVHACVPKDGRVKAVASVTRKPRVIMVGVATWIRARVSVIKINCRRT